MDLNVKQIYSSKIEEIQSRLPSNVKISNSFSSCLETAVQDIEKGSASSSSSNVSDLQTIANLMAQNSSPTNNLFSNNPSDNNTLNLSNYNTNIALSLALSKTLKKEE